MTYGHLAFPCWAKKSGDIVKCQSGKRPFFLLFFEFEIQNTNLSFRVRVLVSVTRHLIWNSDIPKKYADLRRTKRLQDQVIADYESQLEEKDELIARLSKSIALHLGRHALKEILSSQPPVTPPTVDLTDRNHTPKPLQTISNLSQPRRSQSTPSSLSLIDSTKGKLTVATSAAEPSTDRLPEKYPNVIQLSPVSPHRNQSESGSTHYPYVDVVRNRQERSRLHGSTCSCCAKFYEAVGTLPGHDASRSEYTAADRIQLFSRHRDRFKRPRTPPGFWQLDFPSSQEDDAEDNRNVKRSSIDR
ncbi:uncharacterized protein BYT42DRAFT_61215 [Radiomyces spectabilis]|uniref:uncharacterized protein n=1 Tax=Radiomyces spectabilis TaxID=64574 RepID=UPI00221E7B3C|nr:uncharacterized protein BYT42DRAFT_61215 [Radiomyces spectabilis]KAI8373196.1 hypothetical protein BYT42DRAFT_61215 [Radiomyces spectabilis]